MNKEKQKQMGIIIGVALLLGGLIWYYIIGGQNARLAKVEEALADLDNQIQRAERSKRLAPARQAELNALREEIAQVESQMIPAEQLNGNKWLLDLVNRFIQKKYAVTPTRLSSEPMKGKQFVIVPKFAYSGAAYDLELRGFFHEFGRFLADFETSFPYIRVHDIHMSPLATPSAAIGPAADLPESLMNSIDREQLRISLKLVVLFKPAGTL